MVAGLNAKAVAKAIANLPTPGYAGERITYDIPDIGTCNPDSARTRQLTFVVKKFARSPNDSWLSWVLE